MGRYEPLAAYLRRQHATEVPMAFEDIEAVIGRDLPPSAFSHRAWWSNNPSNNVMTRAWLSAGYQSERVDMESRRLVFRKRTVVPGRPGRKQTEEPVKRDGKALFDQMYGCMAGTVTIAPGVDLTAPTGEVWDAEL